MFFGHCDRFRRVPSADGGQPQRSDSETVHQSSQSVHEVLGGDVCGHVPHRVSGGRQRSRLQDYIHDTLPRIRRTIRGRILNR